MRTLLLVLLLGSACWAQGSASGNANSHSQRSRAPAGNESTSSNPKLAPPRSDRVNASDLEEDGDSSSKDTRIDLSPPPDDAKAHPQSSEVLADEGSGDIGEIHPWDPHKAAKDVEVGDFYFKKKNYMAAESRYREALYFKDNDAIATYRLAVCLEKEDRPDEARSEFEKYLSILPHGPQAEDARKAIEGLTRPATKAAK